LSAQIKERQQDARYHYSFPVSTSSDLVLKQRHQAALPGSVQEKAEQVPDLETVQFPDRAEAGPSQGIALAPAPVAVMLDSGCLVGRARPGRVGRSLLFGIRSAYAFD